MPPPKVLKYSQLTPEEQQEFDAQTPEQRQALQARMGVQLVDDRPQQFAPSVAASVRPSQPVPIDFGGMGEDVSKVLKALPRTAAGAMSGAAGMSLVPGVGQTPMGLGAGALMGAVSGAFGPEINTPEGVGANLMNLALPGAMARTAIPNNVIGNFIQNLLAFKAGENTDKALRTMWPGAQPDANQSKSISGAVADAFVPDQSQLAMSAGMSLVPPIFSRLLQSANTPEKKNLLGQFRNYFQDLDIPDAQRKAAIAEIDRRLNEHAIDRMAEGQQRMHAARVLNEPVLGPMQPQRPQPIVTPEVEGALPPSDLGTLLAQSLEKAKSAPAGQRPQFEQPRVPQTPEAAPAPEESLIQTYNRARKLFGMEPVPDSSAAPVAPQGEPQPAAAKSVPVVPETPAVPEVEPVYSGDTNAVLAKMRTDGPDQYVRGAFSSVSNMERLPNLLNAAEEAGLPEIRTVARGHFVDQLLNATESADPGKAMEKFREFGKQKFGEHTGADILNDVAGSNEAYLNMSKIYDSLEKSRTSDGPIKLFWKQNKSAATVGALGSMMILQKLTGTHVPIVQGMEAAGIAAGVAGGGYRLIEVQADKLGKLIGKKRSAMWDAILSGVEGAGRMTPSAMNAYLGELRRNASEVRIITKDEKKKLEKDPSMDEAFR